jgi:DeoR/GlpR family transcriptional regulator of sugar metabolism
MLVRQRHGAILNMLADRGGITQADLVCALGVSGVTVRRDLTDLHARGLLRRVRGGAVPARPAARPTLHADASVTARTAIAAAAAGLVPPGTTVALSAGAATVAVAQALGAVPDLTVVTNSIAVANALPRTAVGNTPRRTAAGGTHLLIGGVATPSGAYAGPLALAAIGSLHVDTLILDAYGMHPTTGFTSGDLVEAQTNRALVAAARRLVVLADHTRWAAIGIATVAEFRQAHTLISDTGLPADARATIAGQVGELLLVGEPLLATA